MVAEEKEISLLDCLTFLKKEGKKIILFSTLGLSLGLAFYFIFPKTYQATALVRLGEYGPTALGQLNGPMIEEPTDFVEKMKLFSYTPLPLEEDNAKETIEKKLRVSPKKDSRFIEVTIRGKDPLSAQKHISTFLEQIKAQQEAIAAPFIKEAKEKIETRKNTLSQVMKDITTLNHNGSISETLYEKQNRVQEEIASLSELVKGISIRQTHLATPIHAPSTPIFPKLSISLFLGVIVGLLSFILNLYAASIRALSKRSCLEKGNVPDKLDRIEDASPPITQMNAHVRK